MYTAPKLVELLELQNQKRANSLFRKDVFSVKYRAKVGSFPHPNLETLVSASEPCGNWKIDTQKDFGQIGERRPKLPLNGYIPASAIRGIVRAWAEKREEIKPRMHELLGNQEEGDQSITSGKIIFFDAYPSIPTQLELDIVNPQQKFQVFHDSNNQSNPQPFYTFGSGKDEINVIVAIQGIAGKTTTDEVNEVWDWVKQALLLYGVGSRTASGYGRLHLNNSTRPKSDSGWLTAELDFNLYSQGCYGISSTQNPELRPSHWRGWLRSWILRFLLGVMTKENAENTLYELMGTIEPKAQQGLIRIEMLKGETWGKRSQNEPKFWQWKGKLVLSAPKDVLNQIVLPVITFAVSVGGVGRGWRRPLHFFVMNNGREASRGCYLQMSQKKKDLKTGESKIIQVIMPQNPELWQARYDNWKNAVWDKWNNRCSLVPQNPSAETFSPNACSVYILPAPNQEPVDFQEFEWVANKSTDSRGLGMDLIYKPKYKRKKDVGGDAGGGNAYCSWVSIRRIKANRNLDYECQEVVCLFLGGVDINQNPNHLRSQFLQDLLQIEGKHHLFGIKGKE